MLSPSSIVLHVVTMYPSIIVRTLCKVTDESSKVVGLLLPPLTYLHHITEIVSHVLQEAGTTVHLTQENHIEMYTT